VLTVIWPFKKTTPTMKASDQWRVTGVGGEYGREWNDHLADDDPARRAYLDWLGGFFSGVSLAENINFFRDYDFMFAVRRMDEICRACPDDQVCHSAQKVAAELF
jgi:hypothetical protein